MVKHCLILDEKAQRSYNVATATLDSAAAAVQKSYPIKNDAAADDAPRRHDWRDKNKRWAVHRR